VVACTQLTGPRAITLCAASAFPVGTILRIVDETGNCSATNSLTITRAGGDTITGATSFVMDAAYSSVAIESDGVAKWTFLNNETVNKFSYLGLATSPDPANVLSAFGSSALFNGASFSLTLNKSAAGNTASMLFQDAFSARAQIGLIGDDNFSFKVSSNGSSYFTGLALDRSTGAVTLGNARTAIADANYVALATDREIAYTSITAARTVTLPAASAFPSGHALLVLDESGSVSQANALTISPAGSDTINGSTAGVVIVGRFGYCRLISNGLSKWNQVGRRVHPVIFTSSGTYTPSPGITMVDVFVVGGGGGGGGGARQAASTAVSGGAGGGGAASNFASFKSDALGASIAIAIAAGGAAGAAATVSSTAGGNGGVGGTTSFDALLSANGGGGGAGGQLNASSGGGGGGGLNIAGASGSGSTAGGNPYVSSAGGAGSSGAAPTNTSGVSFGGGGAGASATLQFSGGNSLFAPAGGGSGGSISATNVVTNGGNGGSVAGTLAGPVGGSGAGAPGNSPSVATSALSFFFGTGGAGGASSTTAAFAGGGGGLPGGGGGGGGSVQNGGTAGAGGPGGQGYCIIVEYF
jgi:hypothetical protein